MRITNPDVFRDIFNNTNDAIMLHRFLENGTLGRFIAVNEKTCSLLGYSREETMEMTPFDIVCNDETEKLYKLTLDLLLNDRITFQTRFAAKDGREILVELSSHLFTLDGETVMVSIARDLTERLRLEELRKKAERDMELYKEIVEYDRLKTEFFANVSHEIRTPLNLILGSLQLMEMNIKSGAASCEPKKITRYTDIMKQNCYRLLRVVNNLIDITKIDSGYLKPDMKDENIVKIIEDIVMSVVDYVEEKSLTLEFDTDVEEKVIACDADKMERIMLNLLSNSIKFTRPGGRISVFIKDLNDRVQIHVKDTGVGIPEDKQNIVFQRFRQVDKLLTRTNEGSGIGLSIVKSMVEMQGGNISLKSKYGEGTEFIIELPVILVQDIAKGCEELAAGKENDINPPKRSKKDHGIGKISIEFSDIYS